LELDLKSKMPLQKLPESAAFLVWPPVALVDTLVSERQLPVLLATTSARRRIIPHRALDRCAAILPPLLSPILFSSTLRAGPGLQ